MSSMDTKTTISASQARNDFFGLMEGVSKGRRYTLTKNGQPQAVVVGAEEFESIMETLDVMRDFPNLEKEVAQARADYETGNYVTLEEFQQGKRTYDLSNRSARKSAKGTRSRKNKRTTTT